VNETAELVAPSQLDWIRIADAQRLLLCCERCRFVVVIEEFAEDRFELGAMENQQAVEALPADGPDEPLVRTRSHEGTGWAWR